jgi:protein-S-isoprenylcysteine O-methyltransferase Ste14
MTETIFQALSIFVVAAFVVLWGVNLVRVGVSRDKFYTSTEGLPGAVLRALLLASSLVGLFLFCIDPALMSWSSFPFPAFVRSLGFLMSLSALALFFMVLRALGRNFSTTLTISANQTLVVHGPYQWVRHPMYVSFVSLWLGYFFLTANWFIALTGISGFVLAMVVRTPKEEKMMIARFGDEYLDYMKRTGRYLPRLFGKAAS